MRWLARCLPDHAYWLLDEPITDLSAAQLVLRGLAKAFNGDSLSPANSLRLPGTVNTKPERGSTLCHLVEVSDRHYSLSDFQPFTLPTPGSSTAQPDVSCISQSTNNRKLNDMLIHAITTRLYGDYAAREQRQSAWIAALCPGGHARDSPGAHFFYVESNSKSREGKVPTNKDRAPLPKSTLDYLNYGSHVGQRNRTLFSSACQFRDAGYTLVEALTVLVARYKADSEPHEYPTAREQEARKTIQSAYARSPRPDITQFR